MEDEEAGSVESGSRSARAVRGLPKQRPGIKKRRDRKRPRRRRRRSSEEEEEEEESDEEIGKWRDEILSIAVDGDEAPETTYTVIQYLDRTRYHTSRQVNCVFMIHLG